MIGTTLQLVREYHRLSQKALAQKLGISASYLSELEKNKKKPNLTLLQKYQSEFDLPASSLIYIQEALDNGRGDGIVNKALKILEWAKE
ncbi:helix-turn-helix domain-containing protein [Marinicella sp. W31]|uniref:helix-turn-helix domain-containing protein n=1 Tax=Marinicella sp. W31 TaxID=3023713 RepID=UPI0037583591